MLEQSRCLTKTVVALRDSVVREAWLDLGAIPNWQVATQSLLPQRETTRPANS